MEQFDDMYTDLIMEHSMNSQQLMPHFPISLKQEHKMLPVLLGL